MKTIYLLVLMVLVAQPSFAVKPTKGKAAASKAEAAKPKAVLPSSFEFGTASSVKIKDVTLSENAKVVSDSESIELKRAASGLRYKKVAFITANVYVGQVFSNAKLDQSSLSAMKSSLLAGKPFALTLTFLRNVDAEKLSNGFKETLSENGVKIDEEPVSKFLASVKEAGEMKETESYVFLYSASGAFGFFAHGKEQFHLDAAANDVLEKFTQIWFGKAPDSGLESLQKDLLK